MNEILENFAEAFSSGGSGCVHLCQCGKNYYDASDNTWDWEENEYESYEKDEDSFPCYGAVSTINFDNKEFVYSCTCWHDLAKKYINFLLQNSEEIASFFKLEKERQIREAELSAKAEAEINEMRIIEDQFDDNLLKINFARLGTTLWVKTKVRKFHWCCQSNTSIYKKQEAFRPFTNSKERSKRLCVNCIKKELEIYEQQRKEKTD